MIFKTDEHPDDFLDRLSIPFFTTTCGQIVAGAFLGIKADMQNNPSLLLREAFLKRFDLNNPQANLRIGLFNLYRGNFWNYTYTLGCSFTGNNLAQLVRGYSREYTSNYIAQSLISGIAAGITESSWTTLLVARELEKTTNSKLPSLMQSYKKLFPALALRDSIGWAIVQAGALHIENKERIENVSIHYKTGTFIVSGMLAALFSTPADANLRRIYSDKTERPAMKIFSDSVAQHGFFRTIAAGWKPRIMTVSPPFIAYGVSQYLLNKRV